jgi:hypothetical protein
MTSGPINSNCLVRNILYHDICSTYHSALATSQSSGDGFSQANGPSILLETTKSMMKKHLHLSPESSRPSYISTLRTAPPTAVFSASTAPPANCGVHTSTANGPGVKSQRKYLRCFVFHRRNHTSRSGEKHCDSAGSTTMLNSRHHSRQHRSQSPVITHTLPLNVLRISAPYLRTSYHPSLTHFYSHVYPHASHLSLSSKLVKIRIWNHNRRADESKRH